MPNSTIGYWIYIDKHSAISTWLSSYPVELQVHNGVFAPAKPWNGSESRGSYLARYGYINEGFHADDASQRAYDPYLLTAGTRAPSHVTAGQLVPILTALARHPSNPFNLVNPSTYQATIQDGQDCCVVQYAGVTVYESIIIGLQIALLGSPTPAPAPAPPPHLTPVPPPPIPTLPPLTPAAARVLEIERRVLLFLMDSGIAGAFPLPLTATVSAFSGCLLALRPLSVQCLKIARIRDPRPKPIGD
jgi:hypothetical protein